MQRILYIKKECSDSQSLSNLLEWIINERGKNVNDPNSILQLNSRESISNCNNSKF